MTTAVPDDEMLVRLRGVSKIFRTGTQALRDLDLDVRKGEIITLLGPSGCGKSTILRLIAGLDRPNAGTVETALRDRADLGFVFQEATLMPWASVARNVFLPLRLRGIRWADAEPRVMAALDRVGLSGFAGAFPRELSGGMRMRVSVARALVTKPKLLLMDEPFAALDELVRFRLDDDLLALRADAQVTIVFVTHSVFEAVYLSDRIAVLSGRPGRVADLIGIDAGRDRAAFRVQADYARTCAAVSQALAAAEGIAA